MIKIDQNYTDYRDDTDPKYPGGKAVNATTAESTDGTPLLADWMNDVNGALQALFLEAFGDINKVSGKPDNVQESDVLKSIKEIIKKSLPNSASQGDAFDADPMKGIGLVKTANRNPNEKECRQNEPWAASPNWVYNLLTGAALDDVNKTVTEALKSRLGINALEGDTFRFRGAVAKANIDSVVIPGSYRVNSNDYAGALLVFATHSSTGVVQFYKDGYRDEPWMCRNAVDDDASRWTAWRFLGVQLTTNSPSNEDCQRDSPWAASPHWVYNLLTGGALDDVNKDVAKALRDRVAAEVFAGISCAVTISGDSAFGPGGVPVSIRGCRWSLKKEFFLGGEYVCLWVIEKV